MDVHEQITVVDGLIAAKWGPEVFRAMRAGGLTAVNATCIAWEGTRKTLDILAQWYQWFDRHSDLIMPIRHTRDIAAAKASRRTGIILGFQNGSPIEDRLDYLV
jgi:membrane dipeptidase